MIEKIQEINGFGVFDTYRWDSNVCNENEPLLFKKLNIIYGRNYSGKTTLSRIIRSLETGKIDPRFGSPQFTVNFSNNISVNEKSLLEHNHTIRVFNEEFVRENLRFISNPDEDIEPFAILGKDNNKLEEVISDLKAELGSDEEGRESGLYATFKENLRNLFAAKVLHTTQSDQLSKQLAGKATGKPDGIKYKPELYGDLNYNITKLTRDISEVINTELQPLSEEEECELRMLVSEKVRAKIPIATCPDLDIENILEKVSEIVSRKLSQTSKIGELISNPQLGRWVSEGLKIHNIDECSCKFCGNEISERRISELKSHFDADSERLEKEILQLESIIKDRINTLGRRLPFPHKEFYSQFQSKVMTLESEAQVTIHILLEMLESFSLTLSTRKSNILLPVDFSFQNYTFTPLNDIYNQYKVISELANDLSNNLYQEQLKARDSLRKNEVLRFLNDITYNDQQQHLSELTTIIEIAKTSSDETHNTIEAIIERIQHYQRQLHDEEQGAHRVNQLLNSFFGNRYLSLQSFEQNFEAGTKNIRFQVVRDGQRAYHLSEGERSLLAFCYFMAKLEEVGTSGAKPLVWIDDPISSLDGNHIFFVYMLINQHLKIGEDCTQLFISTHSLEFLKYLRRLPNATKERNTRESKIKCRYLLIERTDRSSKIIPLPWHIQEYVTEFNYLFHQIYRCASQASIDQNNYKDFYSFGNDARKFLEIYLFYTYPDGDTHDLKLKRFFGNDDFTAKLIDRVNNEYSHLTGVFERGSILIEQPEMQTCAKKIIERLKQTPAQFAALLRSVGEETAAESFLATLENLPESRNLGDVDLSTSN